MLIGYLRWYKFDLLKAHQRAAFFQAMKCDDNLTIIGHLLLSAWGAHSIYIGLYHDDTSWKWIDNSTVQENSDIWSVGEPDNSKKGSCGCMKYGHSARVYDCDCSDGRYSLCESQ